MIDTLHSGTRAIDWLGNKNLPVRTYFVLLYLVVLLVLFPVISYYFFNKTNDFRNSQLQHSIKARTQTLENKAKYISRLISYNSSQSISEYNFSFLNNIISEAVNGDNDLIGCQILRNDKKFKSLGDFGDKEDLLTSLIHWSWENFNNRLRFENYSDPTNPLPVVKLVLGKIEDKPSDLQHFVTPIYVGNSLWGTVNSVFTLKNLKNDIASIESDWNDQMRKYKLSLYTLACIFVILGIYAAYLFTRPLLRAIYRLRDGVNLVSQGNLSHQIDIGGLRITEFAGLSDSFNKMTENLQLSRKELAKYSESLEEKVTERTKELLETQEELLSRAHEAGMAEMAVGVLHNIGNAITPAKVAAVLLKKELESSPLQTKLDAPLLESSEIIESATDISPEKKKQLHTVVSLLPESIREDYNNSIETLRSIIEKHNYIEEIIHLQMHYARLLPTSEQVDVNKVIVDSLKMMDDLIVKNRVTVETKLNKVPSVLLSESNLLQILINLIKNSCEAMEDNSKRPRQILISSKETDNRVVVLSLKDTGCGFPSKIKDNLFTFGFSTKQRCTGYGLHSSANYLIANNGSIEASSAGPGKGAEFTIRLQADLQQEILNE